LLRLLFFFSLSFFVFAFAPMPAIMSLSFIFYPFFLFYSMCWHSFWTEIQTCQPFVRSFSLAWFAGELKYTKHDPLYL
jgi:hypothetical protein